MRFYDVWPFFAMLALVIAVYRLPFFSVLDETPQGERHRFASLDGLRAILALSVVAHHLVINHAYQLTGEWLLPPSSFYTQLGQLGVSVFFMITAFLFTGKMISDRPTKWLSIYVGRVFRIGPLYLAAVAALLTIVAFRTGFVPHEKITRIVKECIIWLSLGIPGLYPAINGYRGTGHILAGVTWSIHYEWFFYFLMPLIRPFRKYKRTFSASLLVASFATLTLVRSDQAAYATLFACGIFTSCWVPATAVHDGRRHLLSALALVSLAIATTCFYGAYQPLPIFLALVAFFCICSGADFAGLLSCQSAHRVGNTSYGIYLLQGLPMALLFGATSFKSWALANNGNYWVASLICVVGTLLLASLGYKLIEKPGIAAGRGITNKLGKRDD